MPIQTASKYDRESVAYKQSKKCHHQHNVQFKTAHWISVVILLREKSRKEKNKHIIYDYFADCDQDSDTMKMAWVNVKWWYSESERFSKALIRQIFRSNWRPPYQDTVNLFLGFKLSVAIARLVMPSGGSLADNQNINCGLEMPHELPSRCIDAGHSKRIVNVFVYVFVARFLLIFTLSRSSMKWTRLRCREL